MLMYLWKYTCRVCGIITYYGPYSLPQPADWAKNPHVICDVCMRHEAAYVLPEQP